MESLTKFDNYFWNQEFNSQKNFICKRDLELQDRDETETFKNRSRDRNLETETTTRSRLSKSRLVQLVFLKRNNHLKFHSDCKLNSTIN